MINRYFRIYLYEQLILRLVRKSKLKEIAIKMNTLKKFASFEEMKSYESKPVKVASSLKKHNDFEKVIVAIRSAKKLKTNQPKAKQ